MLMLISPSVSVTGSISTKNRLTAGSRQSKTGRSLPSRPRSHGTGRSSCTGAAESVAIAYTTSSVGLSLDERDEDEEPADDHDVPGDRRERRDRELVVGVQDPDDDSRDRHERDDRHHDPRQLDGEVRVAAGIAEGADQERRDQDEERRQRRDADEDEPEDRRGDAPRARLLFLRKELAEDGDEGAGEGRVADEGPARLGICDATVKALIFPETPKK